MARSMADGNLVLTPEDQQRLGLSIQEILGAVYWDMIDPKSAESFLRDSLHNNGSLTLEAQETILAGEERVASFMQGEAGADAPGDTRAIVAAIEAEEGRRQVELQRGFEETPDAHPPIHERVTASHEAPRDRDEDQRAASGAPEDSAARSSRQQNIQQAADAELERQIARAEADQRPPWGGSPAIERE